MYLVISGLAMIFTALLSERLGARLLSYAALSAGTVTSLALCILTIMGIMQEF
jgi:hypothetical protein